MAFVNGLLQEDALGFWGNQIFTVGLLVHCRVQDDFFFFFFFLQILPLFTGNSICPLLVSTPNSSDSKNINSHFYF